LSVIYISKDFNPHFSARIKSFLSEQIKIIFPFSEFNCIAVANCNESRGVIYLLSIRFIASIIVLDKTLTVLIFS